MTPHNQAKLLSLREQLIAEAQEKASTLKSKQAPELKLASTIAELLAACHAVVENWEHGDLAAAARMCQAVIDKVEGV